ncbi:FAD synthetase [Fictibacillus enclensis]|uniref:FAD synthetase n=1 Tax=Fictibacillus enclensis TaxID=1017270 RepID=UPI0024C02B18|nr:FAD synthetase [Fictibacillus enclensis]WHY71793.1 FAD synthetase [Fictibacillus enclensis]
MQVYREKTLKLEQCVITIGAFDGIHIGHQSLISNAVRRAKDLNVPSVVYTFDPPPRVYFQNQLLLTPVSEKLKFIKRLNVDYVILADFNQQYTTREAKDFMNELSGLSPREVWVGPNFQFGKGKEGTTACLAENFVTHIHPLIKCSKGKTVSSTRIRNLIRHKKMDMACELLGRPNLEISVY